MTKSAKSTRRADADRKSDVIGSWLLAFCSLQACALIFYVRPLPGPATTMLAISVLGTVLLQRGFRTYLKQNFARIAPARAPGTGAQELQPTPGPDAAAAIGYLKLANFGSLAAFSAPVAGVIEAQFLKRLETALGPDRTIIRLDPLSVAIVFPKKASTDARLELKSLAHVLSQDITHDDITLTPDLWVGLAEDGAADTASLLARAQASAGPIRRFLQSDAAPAPVEKDLALRFQLEQALRKAVRNGAMALHYQPCVDAHLGSVVSAEALLRWTDPVLGEVSPSIFVPILEETGLIHDVGRWVIHAASRQLRVWHEEGHTSIKLAVNISAVQLGRDALGSIIARTVAAHGLAPTDIELELTETAAMEDGLKTAAIVRQLRSQGFGVAIDDFGKGHSNLGYLQSFPCTKLKIDRDFVTNIDKRPGSQAICKALIELGRGLDLTVLAEGVERYEEVQTLRRLGCNLFQGFYFARPMPGDDLAALLRSGDWRTLVASDVRRAHTEIERRMAI